MGMKTHRLRELRGVDVISKEVGSRVPFISKIPFLQDREKREKGCERFEAHDICI